MSRRGLERRAFLAAAAAFGLGARFPAIAAPLDARPIVERRTIDDLVRNDPGEVARIRSAYANMFAWSAAHPNDPRSWAQQRRLHARAAERGQTDPAFMIHGSHHFFPWHRAYLYFHERILAWHLAGQTIPDPSFRLPVWGWETSLDGLNDPTMYTEPRDRAGHPNPLYHARRFASFESSDTDCRTALTFGGRDFFGYPPTLGASNNGSIENGVHADVHVDVGGDMGRIVTAANDPLFFAHHANIDRLWSWWSALPGATAAATFAEWRSATWQFPDWDGSLVTVRSSDLLDHDERLRYRYGKPSVTFFAPRDAREGSLVRLGSRWHTPHAVRLQASAAKRVALKLLDVRVPGPGLFTVAAIVPEQSPTPLVLGTFIVFEHHMVARANAYLDVTEVRTALLHPAGIRLVLMPDPHTPRLVELEASQGYLRMAH